MSDEASRSSENQTESKDPLVVTFNLREVLTPGELVSFLKNAADANRTPVEHFKAITLGVGDG
jgi:hypothetical protein